MYHIPLLKSGNCTKLFFNDYLIVVFNVMMMFVVSGAGAVGVETVAEVSGAGANGVEGADEDPERAPTA